ncbi:phytanoyl-CoA dioxygenase family protein [Synechococcus sp. MIT S9508]|uniref:phytanoyl-CoA dioxygenase family protein n=1 Tax=Synechococcus sp. MIT S9508 TaxID=1801629 RepID=UPI0007BB742D|nr:phytanoyl-CoA dioxygenase family protein [Synechococcus sp. MIT S9508]KZR90586.1 Phytanoyl-CoA dioxygenase (PhyH) [Synechococcus sp. MIT S9508]
MNQSHPGLDQVVQFGNSVRSEPFKEIQNNGYFVLPNRLSPGDCNEIINDIQEKGSKLPYRVKESSKFAGIYRSPFIYSDRLRDLLTASFIHDLLREIFPCGYQLHLNRAVHNQAYQGASTIEWHRDIPYLHSPSQHPLSISFLSFHSQNDSASLVIKEKSHRDFFYNFNEAPSKPLSLEMGDIVVFDSNLVHHTPILTSDMFYNLFMFTTPIIKPVVNYTSSSFFSDFLNSTYKAKEIISLLGYDYLPPGDDSIYISRKLVHSPANN